MQIEVLGERYQLQDPIGRGGMATIYRGRDMRMDRTVAIKVLREVYSTDPKFVTRFQREAKAASSLQHPNIVQVFDYGQSDGSYFIVMELIEGTDLRRYLRSRGVLAIDRAIIIAHDVALGLGAAHRRSIVHRDVKPQNVLVGRDGSIKLTDFGIASVYKDINAERLTTTGMTLGTVQYYAPEQAQGEIVSPAADVYALGIVMYEMLTGRTPFDGDTPVAVAMQHIQDAPVPPSQLNPNIPPALEEIILRCMEKVPEMRYRDGSTLARALEMLGEEENATMIAGTMPQNGGVTPPLSGPTAIAPTGNGSNGFHRGPTSAPQPALGPAAYAQNGMGDEAATIIRPDQGAYASPYMPSDSAASATTAMEQASYAPAGEAGYGSDSTRPFGRDSLTRSATVNKPRDSRVVGLVTILSLIATIVLLGFSIYLAIQLNFLPFSLPGTHPSATVTPQEIAVPRLIGLTYTQAEAAAQQKGFKVTVVGGSKKGVVKAQWPDPGSSGNPNIPIRLQMASNLVVPDDLIGRTLSDVKSELDADGIKYLTQPDTQNPTDPNRGNNVVSRINPSAGSPLSDSTELTLYLTNDTYDPSAGTTPAATTPTTTTQPTAQPTKAVPTQQPTAQPTQQPTAQPTQQPTAQPTQQPSPVASATAASTTGTGGTGAPSQVTGTNK